MHSWGVFICSYLLWTLYCLKMSTFRSIRLITHSIPLLFLRKKNLLIIIFFLRDYFRVSTLKVFYHSFLQKYFISFFFYCFFCFCTASDELCISDFFAPTVQLFKTWLIYWTKKITGKADIASRFLCYTFDFSIAYSSLLLFDISGCFLFFLLLMQF